MSSDSDRTIDSDELEEIIAQSQKELGGSPTPSKPNTDKIQRRPSFHDLSDSGSEEEARSKKQKNKSDSPKSSRKKCKYGPDCTKKNPDHIQKYDHSENSKNKLKSNSPSEKSSKKSHKHKKESSDSEVSKKGDKHKSDPSEQHKKSKHKSSESSSSSENRKRSHKHQKESSDSETDSENRKKKKKEAPSRPKCKYGKSCYRKNPDHIREYDHEGLLIFNMFIIFFNRFHQIKLH